MALTLISLLKQMKDILPSSLGGTGNGFTKFTGPASAERTFTLPNADATVLTTNAAVTVPQGGTGVATLAAHKILVGNDANNVAVIDPTANAGWVLTSNGASADPTFQAPAASPSFADDEVPSGTIDGSNAEFTLAHTPLAGTLKLYKNGQRLIGGGADYTLATATITYVAGAKPQVGDVHRADYRY